MGKNSAQDIPGSGQATDIQTATSRLDGKTPQTHTMLTNTSHGITTTYRNDKLISEHKEIQ